MSKSRYQSTDNLQNISKGIGDNEEEEDADTLRSSSWKNIKSNTTTPNSFRTASSGKYSSSRQTSSKPSSKDSRKELERIAKKRNSQKTDAELYKEQRALGKNQLKKLNEKEATLIYAYPGSMIRDLTLRA